MSRSLDKSLDLTCPNCGGSHFALRVLPDEGLACAQCNQCCRDFLVLDSEDYWFDVIQTGYPRLRQCACKGKAFKLRCEYFYRDDGDIRSIDLWSQCPSCEKSKCQMRVDIDYNDSEDLFSRPLSFCKTPDLRYDLKDISMYATKQDMALVVAYLHETHRLFFFAWLLEGGEWVRHALDVNAVQEAILHGQYCQIYALTTPMQFPESEVATAKKESAFWKRHEIIRISSPTTVHIDNEAAQLYYLQYSNEWVNDGVIAQKQPEFQNATKSMLEWLGLNLVSWRGKLCFDNPTENLRLFGDRFAKGRRAKAAGEGIHQP